MAAGLVPRSANRWAFGHSKDIFAGNPKYLYLWMLQHRPDIKVTWVTGSEQTRHMLEASNLPVVMRWSTAGIVTVLRAKVLVIANLLKDVNEHLTAGAVLLNLWHGVGLKGLPWFYRYQQLAERKDGARLLSWVRSFLYPRYRIVVTTSDMMQAHFATQFRLPPECCPQLGYSRLDVALDPELAEIARMIDRKAGFEINPDRHRELYVYVPTWRDTKRPFLDEALPDPALLAAILAARNALLYVKPHLLTRDSFPEGYPNIKRWPDEIDLNTYLGDFTGLITDYSSVLYDYLFVRDEGAILYTFDFDTYVANDREILYPFEENVAGLRVSTFDQLCEVLRNGSALELASASRVAVIRERFWGGSERPASPAIVRYVESDLFDTG